MNRFQKVLAGINVASCLAGSSICICKAEDYRLDRKMLRVFESKGIKLYDLLRNKGIISGEDEDVVNDRKLALRLMVELFALNAKECKIRLLKGDTFTGVTELNREEMKKSIEESDSVYLNFPNNILSQKYAYVVPFKIIMRQTNGDLFYFSRSHKGDAFIKGNVIGMLHQDNSVSAFYAFLGILSEMYFLQNDWKKGQLVVGGVEYHVDSSEVPCYFVPLLEVVSQKKDEDCEVLQNHVKNDENREFLQNSFSQFDENSLPVTQRVINNGFYGESEKEPREEKQRSSVDFKSRKRQQFIIWKNNSSRIHENF